MSGDSKVIAGLFSPFLLKAREAFGSVFLLGELAPTYNEVKNEGRHQTIQSAFELGYVMGMTDGYADITAEEIAEAHGNRDIYLACPHCDGEIVRSIRDLLDLPYPPS